MTVFLLLGSALAADTNTTTTTTKASSNTTTTTTAKPNDPSDVNPFKPFEGVDPNTLSCDPQGHVSFYFFKDLVLKDDLYNIIGLEERD